ncbi:hypothetical protein QFZ80_001223 [Paenibacillus sp. V4I7]|nr:hypothetical protein [Paenibacillus sp. V4I7]
MDKYLINFIVFLLLVGIFAVLETKKIISKKILSMIVYPVLLTSFLSAGDIITNPQQWSTPLQIAKKVLLNLYFMVLIASPQLPVSKTFKRILYIPAIIILLFLIWKFVHFLLS